MLPLHGVDSSAEGGNRTHKGIAHTILSRARLPVPPLRREAKYRRCNLFRQGNISTNSSLSYTWAAKDQAHLSRSMNRSANSDACSHS